MKWRKAAKIDSNQTKIVKVLRQVPGVTVVTGMDDLIVGYKGRTYWYEIKNSDCVSKKTGLILNSRKKKSQLKLEGNFTGHYKIVSTFEEIFNEIRLDN